VRAGTEAFTTKETGRRDRLNLIWHPQRGKPAILADYTSATDATRMIADPDMLIGGTNIASNTSAAAVEGGLFLAVTADATNAVAISPHTLANNSIWQQVTWGTDQEVEWEALLQYDAVMTDRLFKCGLCLLPATVDLGTDNDQIGWMAEDDGVLDVIASISNADVTIAGVQTVVASQYIHFAIKFDATGVARTYIDGREVQVNGYYRGNAVDLFPYVATLEDTSAGAHPKINVLGMAISRAIGT